MRETGRSIGILILLLLMASVVAGTIYTIHLIGADTVAFLASTLVGAVATAIVLAALALPIRAWRKNDSPPVVERHHYHDGTRTIVKEVRLDGRAVEAPKLYQLPPPAQNPGAFPELLRAAYQAGSLQNRSGGESADSEYTDPMGDWLGRTVRMAGRDQTLTRKIRIPWLQRHRATYVDFSGKVQMRETVIAVAATSQERRYPTMIGGGDSG